MARPTPEQAAAAQEIVRLGRALVEARERLEVLEMHFTNAVLRYEGEATWEERDPGLTGQLQELELRKVLDALTEHQGNMLRAANTLGIGRRALYRKVKQYSIDLSVFRGSELRDSEFQDPGLSP